jgi:deazaflavin-dependent oxidoreductase (nitroreductase family)
MYAGGTANATARAYVRLYNRAVPWGVTPRRWVILEVAGRTSGRLIRLPLGLADVGGRWYLVSMLGDCNWTKNLRAADGHADILRRGRHPVTATEVPAAERAPVIKRYLEKVPGARPHIAVDRRAPLAAFEAVAGQTPVFRLAGYP